MKSYKHLYGHAFNGKKEIKHFAAHSHHPWPDCTLEAQTQYWKDSVQLLDEKWNHIFGKIIPEVQKNIAEVLNLSHPEMIAIAPNTHEFVVRLFSCFSKPIKILTTDSEFHSFRRQMQRLSEEKLVEAKIIPVEPYNTFEKRWREAIDNSFDMIFTSQVFFNSGLTCPAFVTWVPEVSANTMIVVDGYHAFCAIPTDLEKYEDKMFYLAGGYKYAQSGEGVCFLSVPKNSRHRPINTGWFASFETLNQFQGQVQYSESAMRFSGSTFDASGCYRLNSVMSTLKKEKLNTKVIHQHVMNLKNHFIQKIESAKIPYLNFQDVILQDGKSTESHFVTFKTEKANEIEKKLASHHIIVDYRGDRLRFGFGLYHDIKDVDVLVSRLEEIFSSKDTQTKYKVSAQKDLGQ